MALNPSTLFPSIGSVADQTDNLPLEINENADSATLPDSNEDKVVQEIESLCMRCSEQVSFLNLSKKVVTKKKKDDG